MTETLRQTTGCFYTYNTSVLLIDTKITSYTYMDCMHINPPELMNWLQLQHRFKVLSTTGAMINRTSCKLHQITSSWPADRSVVAIFCRVATQNVIQSNSISAAILFSVLLSIVSFVHSCKVKDDFLHYFHTSYPAMPNITRNNHKTNIHLHKMSLKICHETWIIQTSLFYVKFWQPLT